MYDKISEEQHTNLAINSYVVGTHYLVVVDRGAMATIRGTIAQAPAMQIEQFQFFANPKIVLRKIRNYLAGQAVGLTRDETILDEVIKCAFCRVAIERERLAYNASSAKTPVVVAEQYQAKFRDIRNKFPSLFGPNDTISLDNEHIFYFDQEISSIDILDSSYDLIGDIYETFIGSGYRGQEGQFFTPNTAVRTLVQLTEPHVNDIIIDPACGSGSFLLQAAHVIAASGDVIPDQIHGIDKDAYLVRLAQLHLALQYDTLFPIHCADSLAWTGNDLASSPTNENVGKYTLILANPPFGSKIVAMAGNGRWNFDLAHKWSYSKKTGRYIQQDTLISNAPPQILFVERCLSLLASGGRMGIVLPESVLSSPKYRHVVQYILDHSTPIAIIGMPESLFKTSGRGGTHTKVCLLVLEKSVPSPDHQIFMAEAKWCGHDSRARQIHKDDLPEIVAKFKAFKAGQPIQSGRLGFLVPQTGIQNYVLAPRFYDPDSVQMMSDLSMTHTMLRIGDLVRDGFLSITTGDEVGKLEYGNGDIPFVRTSDLSNWEIKVDPKHLISRETFVKYAAKQDVREGDILMVRDGTYLIGTCALISRYDTQIVYQSHLYKIRVHPNAPFDSYLLLAILSSPPVVAQIKAMSFTQDIIDSLGQRINDILLPVPKSELRRQHIAETVKKVIESRTEARELARYARLAVVTPEE
jgi:type I restriction enzyme M protein